MATIKSYTDLEQSKKLAKILPLESADMHYSKDFDGSWFVDLAKYTSVKIPKYVGNVEEHLLPCWSLAVLLEVLPKSLIYTTNPTLDGYCCKNITHDLETYGENSVDACVEMIIKLNEQKLL